ncbi:hypothetical protein BKG80_22055 [Mycobacteroides chelonae]|nr:hypothetical protein BKG80_22055 [Mycobacteroides chelonae]
MLLALRVPYANYFRDHYRLNRIMSRDVEMVVCLLFRFVHWMGMVNLLVTVGYLAIRVVAVS